MGRFLGKMVSTLQVPNGQTQVNHYKQNWIQAENH